MLMAQLLDTWERSVRVTLLFLSDAEVERIRGSVPQALAGVAHLIVARTGPGGRPLSWVWKTAGWRGCSLRRRSGG